MIRLEDRPDPPRRGTWPEWAESWDGRKRCPRCKARLVLVVSMMGTWHSACSRSGWGVGKCDGTDATERCSDFGGSSDA